jgi:hypothetical protein
VDGLAAAMLELIRDEDKRRRFGAAALERAQEYTLERIGTEWDALLSEVMGVGATSTRRPAGRLNSGRRVRVHARQRKERAMAKDHGSSVKNDKQYEGLRKKGMSKGRAAAISNANAGSDNAASKKGGKKSGSGSSGSSQSSKSSGSGSGGNRAQKQAAGRKGGKASS